MHRLTAPLWAVVLSGGNAVTGKVSSAFLTSSTSYGSHAFGLSSTFYEGLGFLGGFLMTPPLTGAGFLAEACSRWFAAG